MSPTRREMLKLTAGSVFIPTLEFCSKIISEDDWNKMSREERKVTLAKDLICRLQSKNITALCGSYISNKKYTLYTGIDLDDEVNYNLLSENGCVGCAKGGLFFSRLTKGGIKWREILYCNELKNKSDTIENALADSFSQYELDIIEAAFEGAFIYDDRYLGDNGYLPDYIYRESMFATAFAREYKNDTDRLEAICQNIIRNGGHFCP